MDSSTSNFGSVLETPPDTRGIAEWLLNDTTPERFIDNILVELCDRLRASGLPVARSAIYFRIHNPQWLGARLLWEPGMTEADIATFDYGTEATPEYLLSPEHEIYSGAPEVRQDLKRTDCALRYPLFAELRSEGLTDYIAWPLKHTLGKRHVISFATDAREGFSTEQVKTLRDLVPILSLITEVRLKNALARTLVRTYVGAHAGDQVLAGATTRGSGATVSAAIMICDIRDFTCISDMWPRDDVIELLNGFFEAVCDPVESAGGEILKFMGDGLLAIFPLSDKAACRNLLTAIRAGVVSMTGLNERHEAAGLPRLRYGVGVHVGDVMYGNIGSRTRLDFTAIGPAVNVASRLEALTKEVGQPVLISQAFVDLANCQSEVEALGDFPIRGLGQPVKVCALRR